MSVYGNSGHAKENGSKFSHCPFSLYVLYSLSNELMYVWMQTQMNTVRKCREQEIQEQVDNWEE